MTSKNEFIERMQKFVDKQYESGKLPLLKPVLDEQGRSYEDDYYIKCLNCGRCIIIVGKCCDNRVTKNILDKEKNNAN